MWLSVRKASPSSWINESRSPFCLLAFRPFRQRISRAKREEKLKLPLPFVIILDRFSEEVENYDENYSFGLLMGFKYALSTFPLM